MAKLLAFLRTPSSAKNAELPIEVATDLLPVKIRTSFLNVIGHLRPWARRRCKQQATDSELSDRLPAQSAKENGGGLQSYKATPTSSPIIDTVLLVKTWKPEWDNLADQTSPLASNFPCSESLVLTQDDDEDTEELVWGTVKKIEDDALINRAQKHIGTKYGAACKVIERKEGSYNRVHTVQFSGEQGFKCVIRVPACGRPGIWQPEDVVVHRSQALTINYIKRNTCLPDPEVLAYDSTCDNKFGHPFTIEAFLEGHQIFEVWNEEHDSESEERRLRILRSLAMTMKEFEKFSFDAAGTLYYEHDLDDNPRVGPQYAIHELVARFTRFIPTYNNTHQHFEEMLNTWWDDIPNSLSDPVRFSMRGVFKMMKLAIECIPHDGDELDDNNNESECEDDSDCEDERSEHDSGDEGNARGEGDKEQTGSDKKSKNGHQKDSQELAASHENIKPQACIEIQDLPAPETFVLAPPDFNWQNILVDEDCNITGLLDWDRVSTVPRLLGFAKTPLWLTNDWLPYHQWSGKEGETDHDLERYRKAYASYMAEAMEGTGDCIYTGKLHLFDSLRLALEDCQDTRHYVSGWLRAILPRSDPHGYLERIGNPERGFEEGEVDWMRERLGQLFECLAGPEEKFSF
ncbi:hypothetical protein E6O75_ATG01175 [Venturia nashicola]|uniref:Aminoglycoside phosphotransferase domain-containing protein n=1 Tax=Venturia nashicola TaxID=86259 RepID=A0A4Z1PBC5_9PEZI|nr:hypothetical protein E6O75_ATG01175 [Venturia nashicola]